ncbi:DUF6456 domain-containing protein [Corticibacterium sp. UT-5YL-CI-8]|nr:DUF6456 domain-containing protein [Tianweitania sp. UT-5YL-CI-8]
MMEQTESRIVRALAKGRATLAMAAEAGQVVLELERGGAICVSEQALDGFLRRGIVRKNDDGTVLLAETTTGVLEPARREIEIVDTVVDGVATEAPANTAESPLAQLFRRKGRDGRPFLDLREFNAGERLRSDYTRGQIMPQLGMNWIASVSSGRRGGAGGMVELTDAALAARQRVDHAIEAVGPELSGVLIDICCFLKGLERVEAERGWPVRSAKVVLKSALGVLARHYEPATGKARPLTLHWGSDDYRPTLT